MPNSPKPKGKIEALAEEVTLKIHPLSAKTAKRSLWKRNSQYLRKTPTMLPSNKQWKNCSVKIVKKEPLRYFLFYFSATFQNKLRPKNEEINYNIDG